MICMAPTQEALVSAYMGTWMISTLPLAKSTGSHVVNVHGTTLEGGLHPGRMGFHVLQLLGYI